MEQKQFDPVSQSEAENTPEIDAIVHDFTAFEKFL